MEAHGRFVCVAVFLLILLHAHLYEGQELRGIVASVDYFETCSLVKNLTEAKAIRANVLNGLLDSDVSDTTPCGLLGESSNITVITVDLTANMIASATTLVFSLSNLPSDMKTFEPLRHDLLCSGTRHGQDCQAFGTPMLMGFDTSSVATMYDLRYDSRYMPYAYAWSQCDEYKPRPDDEDDNDLTDFEDPGFSMRQAVVEFPDGKCSDWTSSSNLGSYDHCSYSQVNTLQSGTADSKGNVVADSACPVHGTESPLTQEAQKYYTPPDPAQDSHCPAVYCPRAGKNNYQMGVLREIYPACYPLEIENPPSAVMNIIIESKIVVPGGNGTSVIVPYSELYLSTMQDGAFEVDRSRIPGSTKTSIVAKVLQFTTGTGIVGNTLQGKIVVCGGCDPDSHDESCSGGMISDVPSFDPSDHTSQGMSMQNAAFLAVTENPWRKALLNKDLRVPGGTDYCTVPVEVCRKLVLKDKDARGFWAYYNSLRSNTMFGNQCNKLQMTSQSLEDDPNIGTLMCLGGMNGACVPGYEQSSTFTVESTQTMCEIQTQFANLLAKLEDPGASVSFGVGMPSDFNYAIPQYWMDRLRLYRDAPSSGESTKSRLLAYLNGDYTGEIHNFAWGVIDETRMVCSTPAGGIGGNLIVNIRNTGASAGSYLVHAEYFDINDGQSSPAYDVVDLSQSVPVDLAPGQSADVLLSYEYSGAERDSFGARVNLTIPITQAFDPGDRILATVFVTCNVTAGDYEAGIFDRTAVNFIAEALDLGNEDDNCSMFGVCSDPTENLIHIGFWVLILLTLLIWGAVAIKGFHLSKAQSALLELKGASTVVSIVLMTTGVMAQDVPSVEFPIYGAAESSCVALSCLVVLGFIVSHVAKSFWSKSKHAPIDTFSILAVLLTFLLWTVSAQVEIISTGTKFLQCVESAGGFKCPAGGKVTELRLAVTSTVDAEGVESETGGFAFNLNVVPTDPTLLNTADAAECQEEDNGSCRITVPSIVHVKMGRSAIRYFLDKDTSLQVPYSYFANIVGTISHTEKGGKNEKCKDCLCSMGLSYHTAGSNQWNPSAVNTTRIFRDPNGNFDHYRCPYTELDSFEPFPELLPAPDPTFQGSTGNAMNYRFICDCSDVKGCDATDNDENYGTDDDSFVADVSMEFFEQHPMCQVYRIKNPGEVVATVEVSITTAPHGNFSSITDTVTVQTVQENMHGAKNVSSKGFMQLEILNPLTATGTWGPNIPGYIVMCGDAQGVGDVGEFSMVPMTTEDSGSLEQDPFLNPWKTLGDHDRHFSLPIPEVMKPIILVDENMDPVPTLSHTFFYYLNASQVLGVGSCCGCLGVDPGIYAHPPAILNANALKGAGTRFTYGSLIGASQGGTGKLQNFITCIPNFGTAFRGLDIVTPCEALSGFIKMQEQMRALVDDGEVSRAKSLVVENLPFQWTNMDPDIWIKGGYMYYEPKSGDQASLEMSVIVSGDFVSYVDGRGSDELKPNGMFALDGSTFCNAKIGGDQAVEGVAIYKVCNPVTSTGTASYSVQVSCGIETDTSPPFVVGETRFPMNPPSASRTGNLAPGECDETGSGDLSIYTFTTGNISPELNEGADTLVVCIYLLYLSPDVTHYDPEQVVVDRLEVGCAVGEGESFQPSNTTVLIGENLPSGPLFPDEEDVDSGGGIPWELIVVSILGVLIVVFAGISISVCVKARSLKKAESVEKLN